MLSNLACSFCNQRKFRCDRKTPSCGNCDLHSVICAYRSRRKRRNCPGELSMLPVNSNFQDESFPLQSTPSVTAAVLRSPEDTEFNDATPNGMPSSSMSIDPQILQVDWVLDLDNSRISPAMNPFIQQPTFWMAEANSIPRLESTPLSLTSESSSSTDMLRKTSGSKLADARFRFSTFCDFHRVWFPIYSETELEILLLVDTADTSAALQLLRDCVDVFASMEVIQKDCLQGLDVQGLRDSAVRAVTAGTEADQLPLLTLGLLMVAVIHALILGFGHQTAAYLRMALTTLERQVRDDVYERLQSTIWFWDSLSHYFSNQPRCVNELNRTRGWQESIKIDEHASIFHACLDILLHIQAHTIYNSQASVYTMITNLRQKITKFVRSKVPTSEFGACILGSRAHIIEVVAHLGLTSLLIFQTSLASNAAGNDGQIADDPETAQAELKVRALQTLEICHEMVAGISRQPNKRPVWASFSTQIAVKIIISMLNHGSTAIVSSTDSDKIFCQYLVTSMQELTNRLCFSILVDKTLFSKAITTLQHQFEVPGNQ